MEKKYQAQTALLQWAQICIEELGIAQQIKKLQSEIEKKFDPCIYGAFRLYHGNWISFYHLPSASVNVHTEIKNNGFELFSHSDPFM